MLKTPRRQLILLVALSALPVPVSTQSVERVVYVSVLDRAGRPATAVTAQDLTVRENNIDRDVLSVSRATEGFDIAVLVDTSQDAEPHIPEFRRALLEFLRALGDRHEIAVIGFGRRPNVLVDYTRETGRLEAGVARISPDRGSGAYLMDGLIETAAALRAREHPQREIIVVTSEGRELSDRTSTEVVSEVQRAGIVVDAFVVVGTNPGVRPAFEAGAPERVPPIATPDSSAVERARALAEVITQTGGRRENLATAGVLAAKLRELAGRLNNQYRVVYEGPPRLTPPASIEVLTTKPDLRVRATGMPQNRQ